jgi:hypothetical protein
MKVIAKGKTTKRLLMLLVLTGAFAYLRQPDRAQGDINPNCYCYIGCSIGEARCETICNGNQSCINGCEAQYKSCDESCASMGYTGCGLP